MNDVFDFFVGVLIYIVLFVIFYFYSRRRMKNLGKIEWESRDKILRWTLAALIFALCWLVFRPIWFPSEKAMKYDPYMLLLILTTIFSIVATYKLYQKNLHSQK